MDNQQLTTESLHGHGRTQAHARMQPSNINVLIACEESQAECKAFRDLGYHAFSCDIQPCCKRANPAWHIQADVTPYLQGKLDFTTSNGTSHHVSQWHLIIAHPPCTYLCKVGAVHMVQNGIINFDRYRRMMHARDFFFQCLNAQANYVAVENPLPMERAKMPKPSCFVQPSWFGHKYTKKTLYWLRNLPPLMPQIEYPNPKSFVGASRGKYRSRTFVGVAEAIANQWGKYILDELNH